MKGPQSATPTSFLLICDSYPPVIGGSELEAQRVCAALILRGYRITVVCSGGGPMPKVRDWIDPEGVPVRIYAGKWKGTLKNIIFALRVSGMLIRERRNYHFVYFLMQGLHLASGLPIARFLGKPILMKIAGSGVFPLMAKSFTGRLELRWLRQWAHRIMILNEGMRDEAKDVGFPNGQLEWMPNPVNIEEFAPCGDRERIELRKKFHIQMNAAVILYCGRLAPEKALPDLIEAFGLVAKEIPQVTLVLVGDGVLRGELAIQAARLGLEEKIRFVGQVKPADVSQWLKIADVFTLVSFSEGFACALAEAMSTALACVVSDIPANRQLIDDREQGFLTPIGDSRAISSAISAILKDNSLRARMGEAARRRILENYSTAKVVDRYEFLIHRLFSKTGADI